MTANIDVSKAYKDHVQHAELITFLEKHFTNPQPELISQQLGQFLKNNPLAIEDFPRKEGTYTRTVLLRHESGFEAMVARWSKGTISPIHGHPWFNLYSVIHGCLVMEDYLLKKDGLVLISSGEVEKNGVSFFIGEKGRFDNNIHRVHAREETLSLHISSDDAAKGQIFS
jgi:hypothetical protein